MLKPNLKKAIRNVVLNKTINIIGLTTGLVSNLMLILYVAYQLNLDKQLKSTEEVQKLAPLAPAGPGGEPLAYYLMSGWLNNFEIRTEISLWIIFITLCGTLIIALFTVSYKHTKLLWLIRWMH